MRRDSSDPDRDVQRERMVAEQIAARGIHDKRVLDALRRVPRHHFIQVATDSFSRAYADAAQPIGAGQTISQPYIVALMTAALGLTGTEKVLEIGAGSGYQTAILSLLAREVVAIERIPALAERAGWALGMFGTSNVQLYVGDGSRGWEGDAPYDAILVAAVAPAVPPAFIEQLTPGGRLVLPVGNENQPQELLLVTKPSTETGELVYRSLGTVAFVPLVGAGGFGLPDDLGGMDI